MSRLPALRLGALHKENLSFPEVDIEFHQPSPANKFGFTWPGSPSSDPSHSDHPIKQDPYYEPRTTSEDADSTPNNSQDEATAPTTTRRLGSNLTAPLLPPLSRAFSMPLPLQLGHFQHPSRTPGSGSLTNPVLNGTSHPEIQHFCLELADSVQRAIQTLLQLSPPHLFDSAKEQFSSCSVQIPSVSVSALLTSMRNLNYISANMEMFSSPVSDTLSSKAVKDGAPKDNFDIGELLQCVGDSLSGVAAEAGIDLVLHHGDAGIKHIGVKGDECGISYALSHIIHQILTTTKRGDTIEVGLSITGQPPPMDPDGIYSSSSSTLPTLVRRTSRSSSGSPVLEEEGPVVCTFDIAHRFFSSSVDAHSPNDPCGEPPPDMEHIQASSPDTRPDPQFETTVSRRLFRYIGGTLRPSLQPTLFSTGRRCEFTVALERGPPVSSLQSPSPTEEEDVVRQSSNIRLAREPTLEELSAFSETLRGRKVAFYASSQGSFAHHLTRYLTAWGMDISHVPTDGLEEKDPAQDGSRLHAESVLSTSTNSSPGLGLGLFNGEVVPPVVDAASDPPEETKHPGLSFVIIDDDVSVLRRRLLEHRAASLPNLQMQPRKRPALASNHRPRSSPSMRNNLLTAGALNQSSPPAVFSLVPIVHFTSLSNYKLVRDAIQCVLFAPGPPTPPPELIVIPKPAGPRRLLTALHTAVHKPIVDPFFSPIATSPISSGSSVSPFVIDRKYAGGTTPPSAGRSDSGRPARSPREYGQESMGGCLPGSSPLALPDRLDYFPDVAVKKLGGNAASGLVIQSPDGRPAGIFFQPQSRSSSSRSDLSAMAMEREKGALGIGSQRSSRRSNTRTPSSSSAIVPVEALLTSNTPTPKRSLDLPGDSPSHAPEHPELSEHAEVLKSFTGKDRVTSSSTQGESHGTSFATWKEATQNPTKQNPSPSTPPSNTESGKYNSATPPSTTATNTSPISPLKTGQIHIPSSVPRSPSSPPPPENRKTVARRNTKVPKSPVVSTGIKKSKTMGNNIVPPISVLIVEDNAINQTILSTFMRRNKIKYEVAWNGREAIEKWRNGNFHLILMDIQMPVMDGIEATKEIRRLEKLESPGMLPQSPSASSKQYLDSDAPEFRSSSTPSTPFRSQVIIVALTASSLQSDRVAALAAGCNDFLTKPVTNSWLNDKVIEWGSIKALQMWAELRPETAKSIGHSREPQDVKLHVPPTSTGGSNLTELRPLHSPTEDISRRITVAPTAGNPAQRSSDPDSQSDYSPDRWSMSSDDESPQDPITEPPAVIKTPVRDTIELPESEPHAVTGEAALLNFFEESKGGSMTRPTLLGQRAKSSFTTSTSIASVMHDTPGIGGTPTDGLAVAGAARPADMSGAYRRINDPASQ